MRARSEALSARFEPLRAATRATRGATRERARLDDARGSAARARVCGRARGVETRAGLHHWRFQR
jgi:hypothetical protein